MPLPVCTIASDGSDYDLELKKSYHIPSDMEALYSVISDLVGADCWALTVGDETLFNSYDDNGLKNSLADDLIRSAIIARPHKLMCRVYRSNVDQVINIYMFGSNSWRVQLTYDSQSKHVFPSVYI